MLDRPWINTELRNHIRGVCRSLAREFAGVFSPETVERYVDGTLDRFADARVTNFVPVSSIGLPVSACGRWGKCKGAS